MGRDIRCPHCGETFLAVGDGPLVHCAACGKPIRTEPGGPKTPGRGVPPPVPPLIVSPKAAATAGLRSGRAAVDLRRACPSCGTRLEPKARNCPACGVSYRVAKAERDESREAEAAGHGVESAGIRKGVLGGVVMVVVAVVWFVLGWMAGRIFYYPPILLVIGLYAIVKGLATGNYAGKKPVSGRRRP